jgi:pimeloyl-ACP methyl ester carboxylesterase
MHQRYQQFIAEHPLRRLTIDGHSWEYIEAGAGAESLLLLPGGFGMAATAWEYILAFAPRYRVVSLHYPPGLARMAELCDGLAGLGAALGLGAAHVLGGSASGAVGQVLVRRHPALVASLMLAQTGPPQPGRAAAARRCAALVEALPLPLSVALLRASVWAFLPLPSPGHAFWRGHFAELIAAQSRAGLANRFHLLADYDAHYRFAPADLAGWPGRVAIIESAADGFVAPAARAALRALYPAAWLHSFPRGSHGLSLHQPQDQIAAIGSFLEMGRS